MRSFQCLLCHQRDIPRHPRKRDLCEDCLPSLEARGLAWCTRGKHRVSQAELATNKPWCRACERARAAAGRSRAEYAKAWRANNPDKPAEYRAENRERYNGYSRARYWRDPERARAYSREKYARHRQQKIAYAQAWRVRNPDHSRALGRRSYQRTKLRAWGLL